MTYSERLSDHERKEIYAELVMSAMAHYPGGEGAVLAELLSSDRITLPEQKAKSPRFSWSSLFRLPLLRAPSLT